MNVLIAGGGRTATQLARILLAQNHNVSLIEKRVEILARIHKELPTEIIFEGNPIDPQMLEQAGAATADVLAACTTEDEINLAICYYARNHFHVPRIIARINNPRNAWLFDQKFHVDVAVNQASLMASLIVEEMSLGDMMTLLKSAVGIILLSRKNSP